jgi:hypothetical protein
VSESNVKIAHRAVKLLAQAKTFGCIETVRAADALRAAEVILDRAEPKNSEAPAPAYTFVDVDLSIFLPDPPPEPKTIDVEPEAASTTTDGIEPTRP